MFEIRQLNIFIVLRLTVRAEDGEHQSDINVLITVSNIFHKAS